MGGSYRPGEEQALLREARSLRPPGAAAQRGRSRGRGATGGRVPAARAAAAAAEAAAAAALLGGGGGGSEGLPEEEGHPLLDGVEILALESESAVRLWEVQPAFVVLYEPDIAFTRQVGRAVVGRGGGRAPLAPTRGLATVIPRADHPLPNTPTSHPASWSCTARAGPVCPCVCICCGTRTALRWTDTRRVPGHGWRADVPVVWLAGVQCMACRRQRRRLAGRCPALHQTCAWHPHPMHAQAAVVRERQAFEQLIRTKEMLVLPIAGVGGQVGVLGRHGAGFSAGGSVGAGEEGRGAFLQGQLGSDALRQPAVAQAPSACLPARPQGGAAPLLPPPLPGGAGNALTRHGGGRGRGGPAPRRVVIDVREFASSLPSVLHQQGLELVPVSRLWRWGGVSVCLCPHVCVV